MPKGYHPGALLKLTPVQKAWFEEILEDDVVAAVKLCTRGQGKSTEMAALALWAGFDVPDTGDPQVPIIATKVKQAERSIYDVALRMIEMDTELSLRCLTYTGIGSTRIEVPSTHGSIFPMANGVDGLQGLDPSLGIMDEIGHQSMESWTALRLAAGKRPRSLIVGTGTPGVEREGRALWEVRKRVLESPHGIPGLSYTEITAEPDCSIYDDAQLRRANPAIDAGYQRIEALHTAREEMPEGHFRIYHLGQWVEGIESWLGDDARATWRACVDAYEFDPKLPTYVGVDVARKYDTTAVVWGQRRPDGRIHVAAKLWIPTVDQVVDVQTVMQFIRDLAEQLNVVAVAYDPFLFELAASYLAADKIPMVEVPQTQARMCPAFGELHRIIRAGELTHDDDREFEAQIMNGVPKYSERGFTIRKLNYRAKVDACYALAMMYDRAKHPAKAKPKLVIAR